MEPLLDRLTGRFFLVYASGASNRPDVPFYFNIFFARVQSRHEKMMCQRGKILPVKVRGLPPVVVRRGEKALTSCPAFRGMIRRAVKVNKNLRVSLCDTPIDKIRTDVLFFSCVNRTNVLNAQRR